MTYKEFQATQEAIEPALEAVAIARAGIDANDYDCPRFSYAENMVFVRFDPGVSCVEPVTVNIPAVLVDAILAFLFPAATT